MAGTYRFKIKKASNGEWYWKFQSANGETMCASETVKNYTDVVAAVMTIRNHAATAEIINE